MTLSILNTPYSSHYQALLCLSKLLGFWAYQSVCRDSLCEWRRQTYVRTEWERQKERAKHVKSLRKRLIIVNFLENILFGSIKSLRMTANQVNNTMSDATRIQTIRPHSYMWTSWQQNMCFLHIKNKDCRSSRPNTNKTAIFIQRAQSQRPNLVAVESTAYKNLQNLIAKTSTQKCSPKKSNIAYGYKEK